MSEINIDKLGLIRFFSKLSKKANDCIEWLGAKDHHGYGVVSIGNRTLKAHRVAYMLANGDLPKSLMCCHSCDNRACVNPNHLWLGTVQDNASDMVQKDRKRGRPICT